MLAIGLFSGLFAGVRELRAGRVIVARTPSMRLNSTGGAGLRKFYIGHATALMAASPQWVAEPQRAPEDSPMATQRHTPRSKSRTVGSQPAAQQSSPQSMANHESPQDTQRDRAIATPSPTRARKGRHVAVLAEGRRRRRRGDTPLRPA
jgi:hypothetical protein